MIKMFPDDAQRTPEQQRTYRMSVRIATATDIQSMLVARGYMMLNVHTSATDSYIGRIEGHIPQTDNIGLFMPFEYVTFHEMEERLDTWLGAGMHHVQCARCKEPLLVYKPAPTLAEMAFVPDIDYSYREYRAVASGPQSEPITVCPSCGVTLNSETVGEIIDD